MCYRRAIEPYNTYNHMKKLILSIVLLSLLSCTKSNVNPGIIPNGTKCNIVSGVFTTGAYQPSQPVTITDIYKGDTASVIYYDVTDSKGVVWQIPGNDLVVIK